MSRALALLLCLWALPADAGAAIVLRIATAAPDGSSWARELKMMASDLERITEGAVRLKLYFGGIAGDEVETLERIRREQLDGMASGGMVCQRLAPSFKVSLLPGLFGDRDEADYVVHRLQPTLEAEMRDQGFTLLALVSMGPDLVLSRQPIRTMEELRSARLWQWDIDTWGNALSRSLGLNVVPLPLGEAAKAYDEGNLDGFVAIPSASLVFQWSTRARYQLDLRFRHLSACIVIANRSFDRIPPGFQQSVRSAMTKLDVRLAEVGHHQEAQLLGGLFARQGLKSVAATPTLSAEFMAAAKALRERLTEDELPRARVKRVLGFIAEYRRVRAQALGSR